MASVFTKIINGELPAQILYEDERFIAILDINPVNHGHALVITKDEVPDFETLDPELLGPLFTTVQHVARAVVRGTNAQGFNVMTSNGSAAGQEIEHLHVHIIPRFEGDGFTHWKSGAYEDSEEMERVGAAIRNAI
ncbi:MAG: HIT family protein [Candidatus Woesearchaeota archaeon]